MKRCIISLIFISNNFSQTQFIDKLFWGLFVDKQADAIYTASHLGYGFVIKSTVLGDNWQILAANTDRNTFSLVYTQNGSIISASAFYASRITGSSTNNFIDELEYNFVETSTGITIASVLFGIFISVDNGNSREYKQITITTVNTKALQNRDYNYYLYDNFPNLFNPITTIRFSVTNPGLCIIDVYDLLGRKVVNLLKDFRNAGIYEIEYDAEDLPSGVYI